MSPQIIFYFFTAFFIVSLTRSSSILEEDMNAVCNWTVSRKVYQRISLPNRKFHLLPKTEVTEYTCCTGYENENGTCKPQCSPKCENGNCVRPNICACNDNWGGYSCNEPLVCIIVQPILVSNYETVNIIMKDSVKLARFPECHSECHNLVENADVKTTLWANKIYYSIPIDSTCQLSVAERVLSAKGYAVVSGIVIVIIIFLVMAAVCIVCIIRRKRKIRNAKNNDLIESKYDDVGIESIREYDDVIIEPIREYEDVDIYVYDYIDIRQIRWDETKSAETATWE